MAAKKKWLIRRINNGMEELESRDMMAADVGVSFNSKTGLLTITGTANEDRVEISKLSNGKLSIFVSTTWSSGGLGGESNSIHQSIQASAVKNIVAKLGSKNDYFAINNGFSTYTTAKVWGGTGRDVIYGGGGKDFLYGESDNDTLYGQDNVDYLSGGTGKDLLYGGAGVDTYSRDLDDSLASSWSKGQSSLVVEGNLDLTGSGIAAKIEDKLDDLAQGNQGSADVESMEIDLATGEVTGSFTMLHRQKWGSDWWGNPIYAYSVEFSGDFRFNVYSGDIRGSLYLGSVSGNKISVSLADLYKVVQGDLTPLYLRATGLRQSSDYDSTVAGLRSTHGSSKVYFASKAFTDWGGPETLARWTGEAVGTGGASLGTIPAEVANKLRAEATGIVNWLKSRMNDPGLAKELGEKLLNSLASRKNFSSPEIEIKWQKVGYWYESNLVSQLKSQKIDHMGYAIILKI